MEPTIAINPYNHNQIFGVWISRDSSIGSATLFYAASPNAGQSWHIDQVPFPDSCGVNYETCNYSADPSVAFSSDGHVNLLFLSHYENYEDDSETREEQNGVFFLKSEE